MGFNSAFKGLSNAVGAIRLTVGGIGLTWLIKLRGRGGGGVNSTMGIN